MMLFEYGIIKQEIRVLHGATNEIISGWIRDMHKHPLFTEFKDLLFFEGTVLLPNSEPTDVDVRLFINDYKQYNIRKIQAFLIDGILLGLVKYGVWFDFYATNLVFSEENMNQMLATGINEIPETQCLYVGNKLIIDDSIKMDKVKSAIKLDNSLYLVNDDNISDKFINTYKSGNWVPPLFIKDMV